jgi:hypothetical protein
MPQHLLPQQQAPTGRGATCNEGACTRRPARSTAGVTLYCQRHMRAHGLRLASRYCAEEGCCKPKVTGVYGVARYCRGHSVAHGMELVRAQHLGWRVQRGSVQGDVRHDPCATVLRGSVLNPCATPRLAVLHRWTHLPLTLATVHTCTQCTRAWTNASRACILINSYQRQRRCVGIHPFARVRRVSTI